MKLSMKIGILVLFSFINFCHGLQCRTCINLSANGLAEAVIDQVEGFKSPDCDTGYFHDTATCPASPQGSSQMYKCAYFKGTVGVLGFKVNSVVRGCLLVDSEEKETCKERSGQDEDGKFLTEALVGLDLDFVKFDGTRCIGAGNKFGVHICLIITTCFMFMYNMSI